MLQSGCLMAAWWFKHDANAMNDSRVIELELRYGTHIGYALWFKLLEQMLPYAGVLPVDKLPSVSYAMRMSINELAKFVGYCTEIGLLVSGDDCYVSNRMRLECERISERSAKSQAAAQARWHKPESKPKKQKQVKEPTPESEQIQRLRGYVDAIYAEFPKAKNKPSLSTDEYQKLIDKWGDKLVTMQKVYYEWLSTYDKKRTHSDFGTLIKGGWVLNRVDETGNQEQPENNLIRHF